MSESSYHTKMVQEISFWIDKSCSPAKDLIVLTDLPNTPRQKLPEIINNFRPDVFARSFNDKSIYIGEAKTGPDLERPHSISQIKTFLQYLSNQESPTLIIATSWDMVRCARALVGALQKEVFAEKVKVEFLTVWP
jgi:hypothetical protein